MKTERRWKVVALLVGGVPGNRGEPEGEERPPAARLSEPAPGGGPGQ